MNLASQALVNRQSMMPSSSGTSWKSAGSSDCNVPDQFPAGLRVLVVDDDPTCLVILERMLRECDYEVTKCNRAEVALSLLRENKSGFDVVISDVHMPDMDGFKLLVHVGLEMDLPVIMMSADDSKSVVMKGVTHGACDYLIKPVRIEAIRNIWQHVVRKRKHEWKDLGTSASLDDNQKQPEDPENPSSANEGQNCKNTKRTKDDENETAEKDDSSTLKKPRVAWSQELHQQFVNAVNCLGIDKAVPKKILDLMSVPGLTRENVASHLQKFRLYLRRLEAQQSCGIDTSFMGNPDAGYGSMLSHSDTDLQALAASGQLSQLPAQNLATLQPVLGRSSNPNSPISVPLSDQRNFVSFASPKLRYNQAQNQHGNNINISNQMNLLHGIPTTIEPTQLAGMQCSFTGMNNSQGLIPKTSPSQTQTPNHTLSQTVLSNLAVSQTSANHITVSTGNCFPLRGNLGISPVMSTSTLQPERNVESTFSRQMFVPSNGLSNNVNQNIPNNWISQGVDSTFEPSQNTNNMQGELNVLQNNYASGQNIADSRLIFSMGESSGTHIADNPSWAKADIVNYETSRQQFLCPQKYSQDDLQTIILPQQQQQEGIGHPENEFAYNWHSLDNLPPLG